MDALVQVTTLMLVLMGFALIIGRVFEKIKIPGLVGQIFVGIIFISIVIANPEWAKSTLDFDIDSMKDSFAYQFFNIMGELGMIFLMFTIGLETKIGDLKKTGKPAIFIAVIGIIIPFAFGVGYGLVMHYEWNQWLLISVALFAMSTAITVNVLRDLNVADTKEAKIITNASVIDDILCLTLLAVVSGIVDPGQTNEKIITNTITIVVFVIIMFVVTWKIKSITKFVMKFFYIPNKMINKVGRKEVLPSNYVPKRNSGSIAATAGMVVCIGMAVLSNWIGLAGVVGAFIAGMIFAEFDDVFPCREHFKTLTDFMLPFFFIFVGMNVRYDLIAENWEVILPGAVALCVVAIVSKIVSGYIGARAGKMSRESSKFVGVCMIPRGEVGVLVASIGLTYGIFTQDTLYTEIIIMTIVTSIVAPILISRGVKKLYGNKEKTASENKS